MTIHNAGDLKTIDLTAQMATYGVACALSPPQTVAIDGGKAVLPVTLPEGITYPAAYGITVAPPLGQRHPRRHARPLHAAHPPQRAAGEVVVTVG